MLLTHWGRVTHICVVEMGHHRFRKWLVACSAPSHYLNQCWNIVNWTLRNKLQWTFNRNSNIFIQEIAFENVVCKMASILSRPQYVKNNCGMLQYNTNPKLSHQNFPNKFLWKSAVNELLRLSLDLFFTIFCSSLFMWNVCGLLSVQCYHYMLYIRCLPTQMNNS